jgi:hypothetical protein
MKFNLTVAIILSTFLTVSVQAKTASILDYSEVCIKTSAQASSDKKIEASDASNLLQDLELLDHQLRLALNKSEDEELRLTAFDMAEVSRSSLAYGLGKIRKVNATLADQILADCGLNKIEQVIGEFYLVPYMSLLTGDSEEEIEAMQTEQVSP